jgi:fatty-acyl-CoA synthase
VRLHLLLEMACEADPDRVVIGSRASGITMAGLLAASRHAALWLCGRSGTTLAYVGLNGPAMPIALFGASLAGKPFSPLNYRLPDIDLRRLLERSAPAVVLCDADMHDRLQDIDGIDLVTIEAFLAATLAGEPVDAPEGSDQEVAVLMFTSGTTSEPKSAILRHSNLVSYVLSTLELLGADEDEAALVSVPPYHIAGVSAVLTSTYIGRRMVQLAAFTPSDWVESVRNENVTHAMVVPTMLGRILDILEIRGETLPSLRALSYGGGRMPASVIARAMDMLPKVDFVNAYGLTETSSTVAILDAENHRIARASDDPDVRRRLSSVGQPLPTIELEVRDEAGICVPTGTIGEIWVRGDQVSGEYSHRTAKRADGWFPTSDSGWLDAGRFLYVEGRLDDIIVRGGENISACEVEDVIRLHPATDDVAVLGVPDEEWGEKLVAFVVSNTLTSAEEYQQFVRTRLRSTRVPQQVIFRRELPYNETGKLLRRVLKAEMAIEGP